MTEIINNFRSVIEDIKNTRFKIIENATGLTDEQLNELSKQLNENN